MHLLNDVVTLIPAAGDVALQQSNTSPTSVTSPTVACMPPGAFSGYTYGALPGAANLSCLQASLSGMMLNVVPGSLNGYSLGCVPPTNTLTMPTNGYVYSVPTTPVSGLTPPSVQSSCCQPSTPASSAVTSASRLASLANAYGVPQTATTSSESSSTSDGSSPAPLSPAQTMELVWHGEFNRLFAQYLPHMWCLEPTFAPPSDRWRTFKDSAKVRFSCQDCGHGWTSMKGRVVFWFELNFATNTGMVMFKLYGQQCQRCKTGKFEHAMWYPEEVVKVIGNVYNRVGQIYYGFVRPPLRIDRRSGKPRNQHNAELCQACKEGLCKEEWTFS